MVEFLLMILPAFISLTLISYLNKDKFNINYLLQNLPFVIVVYNILLYSFLYVLNVEKFTLVFKKNASLYTVKAFTICLIVSFITGYIIYFIKNNIYIKNNDTKKSNKFLFILNTLILIVIVCLLFSFLYLKFNLGRMPFEQLLFHIFAPKEGTPISMIISFILKNIIIPLIILFIFIKYSNKYLYNKSLCINILKREFSFNIFNLYSGFVSIFLTFVLIFELLFIGYYYSFFNFIKYSSTTSNFIEEHYVDPRSVDLIFPKNKRNLIYIYLESMETSYNDINNGSGERIDLIPSLGKISKEGISFSDNSGFGGLSSIYGTTWTAAALISQTSGIPFKVNVEQNSYSDSYKNYLGDAYSLGEVLASNGYKNYYMLGSDVTFGGRNAYFKAHGDYEIYDYVYAKNNGLIPKNYEVFWGYEDNKLFEFAKDKLLEISKNSEPFNFTMLTVDTHFFDGYLDPSCTNKYDVQIKSVIECNDNMIGKFISWIKKQDFYKDTTVVLIGDHLNMDETFFDGQDRHIYNTFLNPSFKCKNTNNRVATVLDMYPTTLASLGVKIEGDQLGLGVNLCSDKLTLPEEYGLSTVDLEFQKKSDFYNKTFSYKK